jgi:hypothetical protein
MKDNLNKAFRELRKAGYFARQNFWCCQSCGWSAVPEEKAHKVVFYHNQDMRRLQDRGSCHLCWAGNGKEICDILISNGVKVTWNGKDEERIEITLR